MDWILDRRSVRAYRPDPVDKALVERLLEAGAYAPSARNLQPRHFIAVDDRALLDRLHAALPNTNGLDTAPLAVIVCGDEAISPEYVPHDCAAAVENILLRATELGLGSLWCAVHPSPQRIAALRSVIAVPEGVTPFALVVLGYAAGTAARPERVDRSRVHYNGW